MKRFTRQKFFQYLKKNGKVYHKKSFKLVVGRCDDHIEHDFRLAVITTKKIANAVHRNKIKRWIREYIRQSELSIPPKLCYLFISKRKILKLGKKIIVREINEVIDQVQHDFE